MYCFLSSGICLRGKTGSSNLGSFMNKPIVFLLLIGLAGGGFYFYKTQTKKTSGIPAADDLNAEFEKAARENVPLLVRGLETAQNYMDDYRNNRPDGTT